MRKVIRMGNSFLERLNRISSDSLVDFRSPTGCSFESARILGTNVWLETPEDFYKIYKINPNTRIRLSLIANHRRWYSVCKIKNIYAVYEVKK